MQNKANKKETIPTLQIHIFDKPHSKNELQKDNKTFFTGIFNNFNKYKVGNIFKTDWGEYVKVTKVELLDTVIQHPLYKTMKENERKRIASVPEYEIIYIEKTNEPIKQETVDLTEELLHNKIYGISQLKQFPLNNKGEILTAIKGFKRSPLLYKKQLANKIFSEAYKYGINIDIHGPIGKFVEAEIIYKTLGIDIKKLSEEEDFSDPNVPLGDVNNTLPGDNTKETQNNNKTDMPKEDNTTNENIENSDPNVPLGDTNNTTTDENNTDTATSDYTEEDNENDDENNTEENDDNDLFRSNENLKKYYFFNKFKQLLNTFYNLQESLPNLNQNVTAKNNEIFLMCSQNIETYINDIIFILKEQYINYSYENLLYLYMRYEINLQNIADILIREFSNKKSTTSNV